ncbi:MAG: hypothetical protein K6D38_02285 [Pseudobutyrivibrio sp.]|nr:hypothetical protein [Pseudobutyrivibrio sp.]
MANLVDDALKYSLKNEKKYKKNTVEWENHYSKVMNKTFNKSLTNEQGLVCSELKKLSNEIDLYNKVLEQKLLYINRQLCKYSHAHMGEFDIYNYNLRLIDKTQLKEEYYNLKRLGDLINIYSIKNKVIKILDYTNKKFNKVPENELREIAKKIEWTSRYVKNEKERLEIITEIYQKCNESIEKYKELDNRIERGINQCNKFIKQIGAEDLNILGENGNECFLRLNKNKKILNSDIDKAKNLKDKLIKGGKIDKSRVLEVCHANYSIDQIFNEDYVLSHLVKIHDADKIKSEASSFIPTTYSQAFGYNQVYDFVDSHEPIAGQSYGQNQNAYVPRNFNPIFNGNHNRM